MLLSGVDQAFISLDQKDVEMHVLLPWLGRQASAGLMTPHWPSLKELEPLEEGLCS